MCVFCKGGQQYITCIKSSLSLHHTLFISTIPPDLLIHRFADLLISSFNRNNNTAVTSLLVEVSSMTIKAELCISACVTFVLKKKEKKKIIELVKLCLNGLNELAAPIRSQCLGGRQGKQNRKKSNYL